MKKAVISGIMVVLVILGIGISYMQFQGKALQRKSPSKEEQKSMEENDKRMENLMLPGQEGEIDEKSEAFAKELQEKAGLTVDPKNIESVGSPITSGTYSFTVDSWRASKESPGYALPEGMDFNAYGDFPQVDANGNITNEFTNVIANITVENLSDEPITGDGLWGYLTLQAFDMGEFISEVQYLGEETPRENGHNYFKESFAAGEMKSYPVVFFMPDDILNSQEIYLEIDTSGANPQPSDPEYAVKRFIILN